MANKKSGESDVLIEEFTNIEQKVFLFSTCKISEKNIFIQISSLLRVNFD